MTRSYFLFLLVLALSARAETTNPETHGEAQPKRPSAFSFLSALRPKIAPDPDFLGIPWSLIPGRTRAEQQKAWEKFYTTTIYAKTPEERGKVLGALLHTLKELAAGKEAIDPAKRVATVELLRQMAGRDGHLNYQDVGPILDAAFSPEQVKELTGVAAGYVKDGSQIASTELASLAGPKLSGVFSGLLGSGSKTTSRFNVGLSKILNSGSFQTIENEAAKLASDFTKSQLPDQLDGALQKLSVMKPSNALAPDLPEGKGRKITATQLYDLYSSGSGGSGDSNFLDELGKRVAFPRGIPVREIYPLLSDSKLPTDPNLRIALGQDGRLIVYPIH